MTLPLSPNIEIPILHELHAVGGTDELRYLYLRLISYFPSLSDAEISQIKFGSNKRWRGIVQKAGKVLDDEKYLRRQRGVWTLTEKGNRAALDESHGIVATESKNEALSHADVQQMLCEIARILGFAAEREFEYYDVVWRETAEHQRLSHVFEVQSKGNIDSAFAKLKRAFDAQRSQPFLILASERDSRRAAESLKREFRELQNILIVLSFNEIRKIYENLDAIKEILPLLMKT